MGEYCIEIPVIVFFLFQKLARYKARNNRMQIKIEPEMRLV